MGVFENSFKLGRLARRPKNDPFNNSASDSTRNGAAIAYSRFRELRKPELGSLKDLHS